MSIKILPMATEHIKGIAKIEEECFSKPWSESAIKAELSNPTAMFFVAVENGIAVGYIGLHIICDEGYIANLAVLPTHRKTGIAKNLINTAIGLALGMELKFLTLEVRPSNLAAVSLYKSFDFKIAGRRKNFYSSPKEDGYIMTLLF